MCVVLVYLVEKFKKWQNITTEFYSVFKCDPTWTKKRMYQAIYYKYRQITKDQSKLQIYLKLSKERYTYN